MAGIVFAVVVCSATSGGHFNPCMTVIVVVSWRGVLDLTGRSDHICGLPQVSAAQGVPVRCVDCLAIRCWLMSRDLHQLHRRSDLWRVRRVRFHLLAVQALHHGVDHTFLRSRPTSDTSCRRSRPPSSPRAYGRRLGSRPRARLASSHSLLRAFSASLVIACADNIAARVTRLAPCS
jgi:hypothetical protein